jgi:hypothetical protein
MATFDVFNGDGFTCSQLAVALENVPYKPGFLGSLGIFTPVPSRTTTIEVESRDDVLAVIQTSARGTPPAPRTNELRKLRLLQCACGGWRERCEIAPLSPTGPDAHPNLPRSPFAVSRA